MSNDLISSRNNPRYKQLRKLCIEQTERQELGLFPVFGELYLLQEALSCGAIIDTVVSAPNVLRGINLPDTVKRVTLTPQLMESLVPLCSTAPIFFTCPLPFLPLTPAALQSGKHLVIDGLQDPGNVGTLLRTAVAFGFKSVIISDGSVDVYGTKVVRAAAGALFKIDIYKTTTQELAKIITRHDIMCYAATHCDNALTPADLRGREGLLIIGNEGSGISAALREVSATVSIPMTGDSLNAAVASGILMWEMRN